MATNQVIPEQGHWDRHLHADWSSIYSGSRAEIRQLECSLVFRYRRLLSWYWGCGGRVVWNSTWFLEYHRDVVEIWETWSIKEDKFDNYSEHKLIDCNNRYFRNIILTIAAKLTFSEKFGQEKILWGYRKLSHAQQHNFSSVTVQYLRTYSLNPFTNGYCFSFETLFGQNQTILFSTDISLVPKQRYLLYLNS